MWIRSLSVAALLCAATAVAPARRATHSPPERLIHLTIETERGTIAVDLDSTRAPITVANFLRYVDRGFYTNGRFHRTVTLANQPNDAVRIELIQGGPDSLRAAESFPPIPLESTTKTGLRHHDGTLSMARVGPNTATSDFFICIGEQPALDFGGRRNPDGLGFAAFGRVTSGMEVVRQIQHSAAQQQQLTPPVRILRVRRTAGRRPAEY